MIKHLLVLLIFLAVGLPIASARAQLPALPDLGLPDLGLPALPTTPPLPITIPSPLPTPLTTPVPLPLAPPAIADLSAIALSTASVRLSWTRPTLESVGPITYEIRYSQQPFSQATWGSASLYGGSAVASSQVPGSGDSHTFVMNGLSRNTTYYTAVRYVDAVIGSQSGMSNLAAATTLQTTPPADDNDSNESDSGSETYNYIYNNPASSTNNSIPAGSTSTTVTPTPPAQPQASSNKTATTARSSGFSRPLPQLFDGDIGPFPMPSLFAFPPHSLAAWLFWLFILLLLGCGLRWVMAPLAHTHRMWR